ncbi:nucleotidyltransferase family protein (plasmid) [Agrobacterium sp. rho-8.1]|nr:nucleotidyltransferase family protein [Agrobacterium sp. rho-8.1]
MTNEQSLLLALSKALAHGHSMFEAGDDLETVDVAQTLRESVRQGISPIFSRFVMGIERGKLPDSGLNDVLYDILLLTSMQNAALSAEIARIMFAFKKQRLNILPRKGAVYAYRYYPDPAMRSFKDVDFYVNYHQRKEVEQCLSALGYVRGVFDRRSGEVNRLDRRQELMFQLYPTHHPPLVRLTGNGFLPAVKLDLAFKMGWEGTGFEELHQSILSDAFAQAEGTNEPLFAAGTVFHLIDCALHLYREAFFEKPDASTSRWTGVSVKKFLDLAMLFRNLERSDLVALSLYLSNREFAKIFAWVSFHIDSIFETKFSSTLGLDPINLGALLDRWVAPGGSQYQWPGNMTERLFCNSLRSICKA